MLRPAGAKRDGLEEEVLRLPPEIPGEAAILVLVSGRIDRRIERQISGGLAPQSLR